MGAVSVRYIVDDLDAAIASSGRGGGGQITEGGGRPEPGGWNRFQIGVDDLAAEVERLRAAGVTFRTEPVSGVGGDQVMIEDPSGNPVEIFQPKR